MKNYGVIILEMPIFGYIINSIDLTNNDIFKKLRVAHKLRDDDIVKILALVDFRISKSELNAFFRREDHPNYRAIARHKCRYR